MTKTYTLAIGADMLLATVPDGSDIEAAVLAECGEIRHCRHSVLRHRVRRDLGGRPGP